MSPCQHTSCTWGSTYELNNSAVLLDMQQSCDMHGEAGEMGPMVGIATIAIQGPSTALGKQQHLKCQCDITSSKH